MSELDPERFTLRQAAQARDDFAQIMDELEFLKAQLAGLPTRRDQAFVPAPRNARQCVPIRWAGHPVV
jgi:hypothetical protein